MDHSVWRYLSRHLSHHAKTPVAPDLPGHGSSPGPGLGSIEEMADWIATKVVPPGGEAFTVIGHSMGGLVALELAARLPDMVSHLVLLACAAEMPVHPQLLDAANRQHRQAIDLILGWSFPNLGQPSADPGPGFSAAALTARILERGLGRSLVVDLNAVNGYRGTTTASAVVAKTLVLAGGGDRMVSQKAVETLASGIGGATFVVLDDVGHMLMLEAPARIRTLLGGFVPRF